MALGNRKNKKRFTQPKLQLTSMMDMFTIILIFLLFSFSNDPQNLTYDKEVLLPKSTAKLKFSKNIKLVLSQKSLQLEDKVVAQIEDGKIKGLDPKDFTKSKLYKSLKKHQEEFNLKAENNKEANLDETAMKESSQHVLFFCDKRHSFKTINNIIKTAAMAGYPNFQFAVLQK
jgi:biopolymer transport protein ExbD